MGLRPQTLYGIADSPVGLAAYFLDHDAWSYALISRVFSGEAAGLTRDDVLENITITWLTNTAISGARLYWESKLPYFSVKGVSIPVAVSAFPDEIDLCPRRWAERAALRASRVIWVAPSVLCETRWCRLSASSGVGLQFGTSTPLVPPS